MEGEEEINDELSSIKKRRRTLELRIDSLHKSQEQLISSLQSLVPNIVPSLDLSLKIVSSFNGLPYTPNPNPNPIPQIASETPNFTPDARSDDPPKIEDSENFLIDESGSPLTVVRSMVAASLLRQVPFTPVDSSMVLRRLETDPLVTAAEKSALYELCGESGAILAVEMALRSMKEENGGFELEEYSMGGKSRVTVVRINRDQLVNELPETSQYRESVERAATGGDANGGGFGVQRSMQEPWMGSTDSIMYPGGGNPGAIMLGPRGVSRGGMGMMGMPRGVGVPSIQRPQIGLNQSGGSNAIPLKPRTEEDDMKDLEALLSKKSFKELQKSKTGEELLDLIHRPTAKETAVAAKFKTKGGSQLKEYCSALTKEDCRRQSGSYIACEKVHFRRIIALHTDVNLGDCSFLDTCRHMKTCKYVHYELDPTPDVPPMMAGTVANPPQKPLKPQRAEYCSQVELGEPQWINCDIRTFRMDILGQFGVIMADPPWDIHMELPYGTMADDEMRTLNVPALQTDGLIFLWVTGRAMELGRECLELWGYKRVEEVIWVKTNQLQRIIRTGRTGHWLNHSKEHCLVGIKGDPEVNRNIDTDVIVAEVRETSRKPDEMYPLLERISPRTRKLELFARMHNTHAGWMSLGNQLSGVRLVDEGLRARFKAAYPDVGVEPVSPPRVSAIESDSIAAATQIQSPSVGIDSKPTITPFPEPTPPPDTTEAKPLTDTETVT